MLGFFRPVSYEKHLRLSQPMNTGILYNTFHLPENMVNNVTDREREVNVVMVGNKLGF